MTHVMSDYTVTGLETSYLAAEQLQIVPAQPTDHARPKSRVAKLACEPRLRLPMVGTVAAASKVEAGLANRPRVGTARR